MIPVVCVVGPIDRVSLWTCLRVVEGESVCVVRSVPLILDLDVGV